MEIISVKRVHFLPSLYYNAGDKIGDLFNKNHEHIGNLDKFILKTPLNFFAQDFEIICKKNQVNKKTI